MCGRTFAHNISPLNAVSWATLWIEHVRVFNGRNSAYHSLRGELRRRVLLQNRIYWRGNAFVLPFRISIETQLLSRKSLVSFTVTAK